VAIVTGAAQGIGADAGQQVADDIWAGGGTAAFVRTDVSDPKSAQAMAAQAAGRYGGIDYLVNNAAIDGTMRFDVLVSVDWDYYKRRLTAEEELPDALWRRVVH
jgi:NAD(P)-dependent dehydrogenase (short-subunit alcohol dehydrogenase family)